MYGPIGTLPKGHTKTLKEIFLSQNYHFQERGFTFRKIKLSYSCITKKKKTFTEFMISNRSYH